MNKKISFLLLLVSLSFLVLFVNIALIIPPVPVVEARPDIWVPDDYAKIQWAVGNSTDGDTIRVRNGSYTENVVVYKSVRIIGNGSDTTNVTASSPFLHVFHINVSDVEISGFNITGATGWLNAGIYVEGNSSTIEENIITGNWHGIYLNKSWYSTISQNNVTSNLSDGILLDKSSSNVISNNPNISFNGAPPTADGNGIFLLALSTNNTMSNNNLANNTLNGISLANSNNNTISDNQVWRNGVSKVLGQRYGINALNSDHTIVSSNNASGNKGHGIYLDNSNNSTVSDNIASSNGLHGIFLNNLDNTTVTHNNVTSNNNFGIWLDNCDSCEISGNNVTSNLGDGILLDNTDDTKIFDNIVKSNGAGIQAGIAIRTPPSVRNTIYNNYCNNTINAVDTAGPNDWNITKKAGQSIIGGSWLGGNFWSDYTGFDRRPYDGIGDTRLPYNCSGRISGSPGDWLPLTNRKGPFAILMWIPHEPLVDETVFFSAEDSYDPDGIIIEYFWDFGDETHGTGETIEHVYHAPGDYTVTLTVTDNEGQTDVCEEVVTVSPPTPPPVPEFPIGPALEILFISAIIYTLWRSKRRKKMLP